VSPAAARAAGAAVAPAGGVRDLGADAAADARAAGLRHVSDRRPGIVRRPIADGRRFAYRGPDGRPVRDPATRARIASLAIPPAWTEVWICPDPRGHLQATGRDARGRKQYRYHPRWREFRDATKYGRLLDFAAALPRIRAAVAADLRRLRLSREKVLATVVAVMESTGIRVGNEEYRRANGSHGLTTLRDHHADVAGPALRLRFKGKSGKLVEARVEDRRLARIVAQCQEIPGEELFQYLDEDGQPRDVGSGDVNDYLRQVAGADFTAKDFRTWNGTLCALADLVEREPPSSEAEAKRAVVECVDRVAELLANTRAVCRKFYIHPGLLESYADGRLPGLAEAAARRGRDPELSPQEAVLVGVLEALAEPAARAA
jgi:DNA topoisomerase-1